VRVSHTWYLLRRRRRRRQDVPEAVRREARGLPRRVVMLVFHLTNLLVTLSSLLASNGWVKVVADAARASGTSLLCGLSWVPLVGDWHMWLRGMGLWRWGRTMQCRNSGLSFPQLASRCGTLWCSPIRASVRVGQNRYPPWAGPSMSLRLPRWRPTADGHVGGEWAGTRL